MPTGTLFYLCTVCAHPLPLQVARLTGNPLSYFAGGWQAMDFASTCLLVACAAMWWVLVWRHAIPFAIDLRFNVYADLGADAARLSLAEGGAGLQGMHAAFGRLQSLSDKLAWYAALTGINLLMLIARMLQLMDFQVRVGWGGGSPTPVRWTAWLVCALGGAAQRVGGLTALTSGQMWKGPGGVGPSSEHSPAAGPSPGPPCPLPLPLLQPRLGVVTRSLAHAGPDLLHFGLVFGLVFIGYAMLAHLIFGNSIAGGCGGALVCGAAWLACFGWVGKRGGLGGWTHAPLAPFLHISASMPASRAPPCPQASAPLAALSTPALRCCWATPR